MNIPALTRHLIICHYKELNFQHIKDQLSTIVLGSSHGYYGFNTNMLPHSFNLCSPSQDLKYSYLLLDKVNRECNKLKNIILFYSIFSPGSDVEKSASERVVAIAMNNKYQLGINYSEEELISLNNFAKNIKIECENPKNYDHGYPPFILESINDSYGVSNRARDHLRFNLRHNSLGYLSKIIALAYHRRQRIFIVLPPYRSDYKREIIQNGGNRYSGLTTTLELAKSFIKPVVLDFFDNTNFIDSDFIDFDHLNHEGAIKLTNIVNYNMLNMNH